MCHYNASLCCVIMLRNFAVIMLPLCCAMLCHCAVSLCCVILQSFYCIVNVLGVVMLMRVITLSLGLLCHNAVCCYAECRGAPSRWHRLKETCFPYYFVTQQTN
jgi:hypothetical protein